MPKSNRQKQKDYLLPTKIDCLGEIRAMQVVAACPTTLGQVWVGETGPEKLTPQVVFDRIKDSLATASLCFDRTTYLDVLVRVSDEISDRCDEVHRSIAKEHHEDRDV